MSEITLAEMVAKWDKGEFDSPDVHTMIAAGWYDWFCRDESLYLRLKRMMGMVKAVNDSPLVDNNKVYVFFKNNSPVSGKLYDSFSICDMDTGDVVWWVAARYSPLGYAVINLAPAFGPDMNMIEPGGNANDVKRFFKSHPDDLDERRRLFWVKTLYQYMRMKALNELGIKDREDFEHLFEFHSDLHGRGPSIVATNGCLELEKQTVRMSHDGNKYVNVPSPDEHIRLITPGSGWIAAA